MMRLPLLFCVLLPALLASCASGKKPGSKSESKPAETAGGQATLVGMIEMVNPEQNYVLIRAETQSQYSAGTELTALGAGGSKAKLVLTPEKKGFYLTADIKGGQPQVADLVLFYPSAAPEPPPAPAPTPAPAPPSAPAPPVAPQPLPLPMPVTGQPPPTMPGGASNPATQLEPVVE